MRYNISEGVTEGKIVCKSLMGGSLDFAVFPERTTHLVQKWRVGVTLPHLPVLGVGVLQGDVREECLCRLYEFGEVGCFMSAGVVDDAQVLKGYDEFEQFALGACPLERGKLRRSSLEGGEESGIFKALLVMPDGVADELQAVAIECWSGAFFPLDADSRTVSASAKM